MIKSQSDSQMYTIVQTKPEVSRQLCRIGSNQLPLLAQVLVVDIPGLAVLQPEKREVHSREGGELEVGEWMVRKKLKLYKNLKATLESCRSPSLPAPSCSPLL